MLTTKSLPRGALLALASALLFGASTPLAKLFLGEGLSPLFLAGLLYLGSGLGLALITLQRHATSNVSKEAALSRADLPWLVLTVFFGGIAGPVLLMIGLSHTASSIAALLLNLESVATIAIAWLVFREHTSRDLAAGAAIILAGAVLLSWQESAAGFSWGALAIAGACVAWAIDNNVTRQISGSDPFQIAMTKGLVAGAVNLILAFTAGVPNLSSVAIIGALILGFFGYGLSLVLFVLALRHLGTARTGAYFSSAPFVGAAIGMVLFNEPLTVQLVAAAFLMGAGVYLHIMEAHGHHHMHEALEHEHRHFHDLHHDHTHDDGMQLEPEHSHRHRHDPATHMHPHYPDLHHRHTH